MGRRHGNLNISHLHKVMCVDFNDWMVSAALRVGNSDGRTDEARSAIMNVFFRARLSLTEI